MLDNVIVDGICIRPVLLISGDAMQVEEGFDSLGSECVVSVMGSHAHL